MGESLKKIYKVNDFYSTKSGRYMTATEISSFLKESDKWKLIGPSYEQKTLASAQELANSGKAVVAVYVNSAGIGHMVVITPGQLQQSGSWGLNVPSVVSFFPSQPDKSFVDKGLSFAFGKNLMKDILNLRKELATIYSYYSLLTTNYSLLTPHSSSPAQITASRTNLK